MNKDIFTIENKILDCEQIQSVEYIGNQLVIAGAGAGKTLSIVGKIKYLLQIKKVKASEILLLAFTDKVVNELIERVGKVTNSKIDILTFHKLGLKIFNKSNNHFEINPDEFYSFLHHFFYNGEYEKYIELASNIYNFLNQNYVDNNIQDLSNIKVLTNSIKKISLKGDKVNSVIALIACNMLFVNNIDYEYVVESMYSHYIKIDNFVIHFTKKISFPNCLSLKDIEMDQIPVVLYNYLNNIGKRVDSFSYYKSYLSNPGLAKKFERFFDSLIESQKIASASGIYDADFDYLIEHYCVDKPDAEMFLNIFRRIRAIFCYKLKEEYKTDFDYMIYGPIEILRNNKFLPYKYIIVDEYQDISPARYNLLIEILKQNDGYLMAYGDDWQSIYSFSGSNNKFFMEFSKKIPDAKEFYLKNTYRNSQQLIDASAGFVMLNPCQKIKHIESSKSLNKPIKILKYSVSNADSLLYTLDYIKDIEKNKEVNLMVLGRTNYAINMLMDLPEIIFIGEDSNKRKLYQYGGYSNIKIEFLTIHRAKGLEADYVFVTGANDKDMPLEPNKNKQYIDILSKLNEYEEEKEHEKYEGLPSSEERRLFYVALTRSKNFVFISTPNLDTLKASMFINDLSNTSSDKLEFIEVPKLYDNKVNKCPVCGGIVNVASKKGRKYSFCENKCKI